MVTFFFQPYLGTPRSQITFVSSPGVLTGVGRRLSLVVQQLFPADGLGEHLPLQPQLVGAVEILGELQPLAQHALQAVVHRRKLRVLGLVVPPAVEGFDVGSQGALFSLEVPRSGIDI